MEEKVKKMKVGIVAAAYIVSFVFGTQGFAETQEETTYTRYIFIGNPTKNAPYGIEGIQHYHNDRTLVKELNITRMWVKTPATAITFVESVNIAPSGAIEFGNIFIIYGTGKKCIEKPKPADELDKYKRGVAQCTAVELEEANKFLSIGEKIVTEGIREMREKENQRKILSTT